MRFTRHVTAKAFSLALSASLFLAGCSGGGLLADGGIIGTGTIIGTVPGTIIEAYGDQGQYFETSSFDNSTAEHPFVLEKLPAGVGFYLVMIINEGTENEVVMPIAFPDGQGQVFARITLKPDQKLDLGYIPLYLNCAEVPIEADPDYDCILDKPFVLNEAEGSKNPLKQMDADKDGIDDYDDEDHGYGKQNGLQFKDPQDVDDDRVPNKYDDDFIPNSNDEDEDGIDDGEDENPGNWNGHSMHPVGQAWLNKHGEFAEDSLNSCASCHGEDFQGTPSSAGVGCYDCHDGPNPQDDESPGNTTEDGYEDENPGNWKGQGMHQKGQAWQEQHGDYAENNLAICASCHGTDFLGTAASAQVGCFSFGCHEENNFEDD